MNISKIRLDIRKILQKNASTDYEFKGEIFESSVPMVRITSSVLDSIFLYYDIHLFNNQIQNKLMELDSTLKFYIIESDFNLWSKDTPYKIIRDDNKYIVIVEYSFLSNPYRFKNSDGTSINKKLRDEIKKDILFNRNMIDEPLSSILICMEYFIMWIMIFLWGYENENITSNDKLMMCMMNRIFKVSQKEKLPFSMTNGNGIIYDLNFKGNFPKNIERHEPLFRINIKS